MKNTYEKNMELNKTIKNATTLATVHTHLILKRENFDAIFARLYNIIYKTDLCKLYGFT